MLIVVSPAPASRPELHTTAFGALVDPDVKSSRSRVSGAGRASGAAAPAWSPSRASYAAVPTVRSESDGTPRSSPVSRAAPSPSVTTSWQSVCRTSCASSAPLRVGLMPTTAAPASAAPAIQYRYSGTFSSRTPTWNGPSRRATCRSAARAAASGTNGRYDSIWSSERIAVGSSAARATTSSAKLGTPPPATGSAPDELAERRGLVGAGLGRQAEHALPDHVALHLLRAATDADAPLVHEALLPEPAVGRVGVQQHPGRALQRQREVSVPGDVLRHRQLEDRRLGARRAPVAPCRLGAPPEVLEDLEADERVGEPLPHHRITGAALVTRQPGEVPERDRPAAADQRPLGAERRLGDTPGAVHRADDVVVRDPHVGQEYLVEVGDAVDLTQRPHLDPGRRHVEHEVRDPLVLGRVRVGPGEQDAELAVVRARAPDLLAVHHPLVAVAHGTGPQPGEVGAGSGLAEQLAPHFLTAQQRGQVPQVLSVGPVRDQRRSDHPDADGERARLDVEARLLLGERACLGRGATLPAVLLRPRDARPASVVERALPFLAPAHMLGVSIGARIAEEPEPREIVVAGKAEARVCLEERPRPGPERGGRILRCVVLRHTRAARWTSARRSGRAPRCRTRARRPTTCSRRTAQRSPSCTGSRRTCPPGRAGRCRDHGRCRSSTPSRRGRTRCRWRGGRRARGRRTGSPPTPVRRSPRARCASSCRRSRTPWASRTSPSRIPTAGRCRPPRPWRPPPGPARCTSRPAPADARRRAARPRWPRPAGHRRRARPPSPTAPRRPRRGGRGWRGCGSARRRPGRCS